ncbi:MAG: hypothetical protein P8O03_05080, partial [Ilumatobacter sp.]|nr:hypothetical protein [Ilumatobacter sp.]
MNAGIDWEDQSMLTSYPPIADGELDSIPWPQHPRPTFSHGVQFCSGTGQHDTRQSSGDDYDLISWAKIVDMAVHPTTVDKAVGRWFIPSTYNHPDARSFQRQTEAGVYQAIPVDIDCGNHSLEAVTEATQAILGDCLVIHSSRSSKPDNRKWRAIAMIAEPLAGSAYGHIQRAVIDLYQERGFTLDPALERAAQLIYLPNAGEFYQ